MNRDPNKGIVAVRTATESLAAHKIERLTSERMSRSNGYNPTMAERMSRSIGYDPTRIEWLIRSILNTTFSHS